METLVRDPFVKLGKISGNSISRGEFSWNLMITCRVPKVSSLNYAAAFVLPEADKTCETIYIKTLVRFAAARSDVFHVKRGFDNVCDSEITQSFLCIQCIYIYKTSQDIWFMYSRLSVYDSPYYLTERRDRDRWMLINAKMCLNWNGVCKGAKRGRPICDTTQYTNRFKIPEKAEENSI